jgi:hypothetical protein
VHVLKGLAHIGPGELACVGGLVATGLPLQARGHQRIARFAQGFGGHRSGVGELRHGDLLGKTV